MWKRGEKLPLLVYWIEKGPRLETKGWFDTQSVGKMWVREVIEHNSPLSVSMAEVALSKKPNHLLPPGGCYSSRLPTAFRME